MGFEVLSLQEPKLSSENSKLFQERKNLSYISINNNNNEENYLVESNGLAYRVKVEEGVVTGLHSKSSNVSLDVSIFLAESVCKKYPDFITIETVNEMKALRRFYDA